MGGLPLRTPTHRRLGEPLPHQQANAAHAHPLPESLPLPQGGCPPRGLCGIRQNFSCLFPCKGQVAYVLLTRAPVAGGRSRSSSPAAPRLACVKPVASVHPEPGSNSSLLLILFFSFQKLTRQVNYLFACDTRLPERLIPGGSSLIELESEIDLRLRSPAHPVREPAAFALVLLRFYCIRFNVLCFAPAAVPFRKRVQSYGIKYPFSKFSDTFNIYLTLQAPQVPLPAFADTKIIYNHQFCKSFLTG